MKAKQQRIAIAEVLGWHYEITETTIRGLTCWNRAEGRCPGHFVLAGECYNRSENQMQELLEICHIPNYPKDPSAAATLCDHLAELGWRCEMNQGLDKTWECIFKRPTQERSDTTREDSNGTLWEEHYHPADTLAEAICGAFLRTLNLYPLNVSDQATASAGLRQHDR